MTTPELPGLPRTGAGRQNTWKMELKVRGHTKKTSKINIAQGIREDAVK